MSDTCPKCGAMRFAFVHFSGGGLKAGMFRCGSIDGYEQTKTCALNEVRNQLTAAQARIAELEREIQQMKAAKKQREEAAIQRVTDGIFPRGLP